ncbi:MAG: hypothetical protein ACKPKO_48350 [Candidatus Fonsibacter sp.]
MYSIFIVEETADKPTENQHKLARTYGYGSTTRMGIPDQRNTTTLTMCCARSSK